MAKRFTSTEIWTEDWFLEMPAEYKLFWYYVLSMCDHSGVFKVNTKTFCKMNEVNLTSNKAFEYFNTGKDRIRIIADGIWLIEDFFVYQYGHTFNPNNRVHESVEQVYLKYDLKMTSIRGLKDLKDRVKDKDKDKDKDINKGGSGENKNAIRFSDGFDFAIFVDGSQIELGNEQRLLAKTSKIKPRDVIKGLPTY